MPWRGPEYPGEFPTLGHAVAEFIEAKCAIPDGERAGEPYLLIDDMLNFLLWFYRIVPETGRFYFERGGQLVRPQKSWKSPFAAAMTLAEADAEGPVRFAGWDARGEPVGKPVPTPWIQVTAVSEGQTANVWRALVPMVTFGDFGATITDIGDTRINLPSGGRIEPVTSSARTRLGQRITFTAQDETHLWLAVNDGHKVADTQRRNVAGMGGRFCEYTNAWDPREDSVAQRTSEGKAPGVFKDDVDPGPGSVRNKVERRRMLRKVYGAAAVGVERNPGEPPGWVDLLRIEAEIVALLEHDGPQAERYFLNRKRAGEDAAFDAARWAKLADAEHVVPEGALVVFGVDGARFRDGLAIIGTEVATGFQWVQGIWERPEDAGDRYEHPFDEVDGAMEDGFDRWQVWRTYVDEQWIEHLVDAWQGRWGDRRVIAWHSNRPRQAAWAVRNFTEALSAGDQSHDGNADLARHVKNARRQKVNVVDDLGRPMHTISKERHDSPLKMDGAYAAVISWEARGDAIADGADSDQGPLVAVVVR